MTRNAGASRGEQQRQQAHVRRKPTETNGLLVLGYVGRLRRRTKSLEAKHVAARSDSHPMTASIVKKGERIDATQVFLWGSSCSRAACTFVSPSSLSRGVDGAYGQRVQIRGERRPRRERAWRVEVLAFLFAPLRSQRACVYAAVARSPGKGSPSVKLPSARWACVSLIERDGSPPSRPTLPVPSTRGLLGQKRRFSERWPQVL